jgi:hypothetical protein
MPFTWSKNAFSGLSGLKTAHIVANLCFSLAKKGYFNFKFTFKAQMEHCFVLIVSKLNCFVVKTFISSSKGAV